MVSPHFREGREPVERSMTARKCAVLEYCKSCLIDFGAAWQAMAQRSQG